MAQYRLKLTINSGFGLISVNGVAPVQYYEEGSILNIAISLINGFTSIQWIRLGVVISTATSFSFTMPSEDASVSIEASSDPVPINGYGLKYFTEFYDTLGSVTLGTGLVRLEILIDGYGGSVTELQTRGASLNFGDNQRNLTDIIIGQSLDFSLYSPADYFGDLLTVGIRDAMVVLYKDSIVKFRGFLTPDFVEFENDGGIQSYQFTAVDGMKGLDSIRSQPLIFPGGTSGVRDKALNALIGALNQSFPTARKVNISCDIYEDRMSDLSCMFLQFFTPEAAIYTDGERAKYSNDTVVWNETLFLSEVIEILLKPFLCRVFLWEDEFYVIRVADMNKATMRLFKFNSNSDFNVLGSITNDLVVGCGDITRVGVIRSSRAYTEFTAIINLGVLVQQAKGAVYEANFGVDDWYVASPTSPYPGRYVLRNWDYVNARPSNQPTSVPTGDLALVQYVSDNLGEYCQIWTTTTTAGFSDPNISYIRLLSSDAGVGFIIADEIANKLSLEFQFGLIPVSSSDPKTFGNHSVAIQVKIGSFYLRESATPNVYEFTTTVAFCVFPCQNSRKFNTVKITNVVIPTTDFVEVRMYQLILNTGSRHQYRGIYKGFKLSIEENVAFTLAQLGAKGVTNDQYSSVFSDYETNIGDTITNMSTSAIKLNIADTPVSKNWTSKDFTSEPLLGAQVQDLANLYGRPSQILRGTIQRLDIKPYEAFIYEGKYFAFLNFTHDFHRNSWEFQAYDLGPIETT